MPIPSVFSPASPQGQDIANLFTLALVVGAVVFFLVLFLVVYALLRFRRRSSDQGEPSQRAGSRHIEVVWTLIPLGIVLTLFVLAAITMGAVSPPTDGSQPDLIVIGHQWWWEFRYPKTGVVTANEAHIPAGQRWLVQLQSADVIHSFWVPQLGPKVDLQPDFSTHLWIQPEKQGTYEGACAEYCGTEHAWMRFSIIVDSPNQFNTWQQAQLAVPPTPASGDAARGAQLFQQNTCASCHTIANTTAQGQAGPNLTHLGSRQTIGAGRLPNTPNNLAGWLKNPQAAKPGVLMPSLNLSDADVSALVAYLESLK